MAAATANRIINDYSELQSFKPEPYYTLLEIAATLRVNKCTVRHWILSGELVALRVGKEWRISQSAVDAFVRLCAAKPRHWNCRSLPKRAGRGRLPFSEPRITPPSGSTQDDQA